MVIRQKDKNHSLFAILFTYLNCNAADSGFHLIDFLLLLYSNSNNFTLIRPGAIQNIALSPKWLL